MSRPAANRGDDRPAPCPTGDPAAARWSTRSEVDLVEQQLHGIELFHRARKPAEDAAAAAARTREMRLDSARRMEVLRRQHDALVERTQRQLSCSVALLRSTAPRTVLLAHRDEWFLDEVTGGLRGHGLQIVGRLDNGADVIGVAVAEQPDLVLVADTLAMVPGELVVRDVLRYCPRSRVVAQVAHQDRVSVFLDAGACAVHTMREAPADIVAAMSSLLAV